MFTGIIEQTGKVRSLVPRPVSRRITIETSLDVGSLPLGASVAVDGVCLTIVDRAKGRFSADIGPETLACTTLGDLGVGDTVHLERALRLGDSLGGHLVTGHVDGTGRVSARKARGDALELTIEAPAAVARTLVVKGSITVDGVSLTVNSVRARTFSVTLVPHTLAVTALGDLQVGSRVNLEADLIGKHVDQAVARALAERGLGGGGLRAVIGLPPRRRRPGDRDRADDRKIRLPKRQPW